MAPKPNRNPRAMRVSPFWRFFGVGMCFMTALIAAFIAPIWIGKYLSHALGGCAAILNIIVWLYGGFKVFMITSTRISWILMLIMLIAISIREFQ
jgi:hypothetical protein